MFQSLKKHPGGDLAAYGVIGIAVVFYILTIRPGHDWGGDFALYIEHAINISEGRAYSDTGFVYNARDPFLSPRTYPPVYPLFLASVYGLFGLNLYAMKIAGVLVFAVFLLLFNRYAASRLHLPVTRVLVVAFMAFSPWFWEAKDRILPDFLFILILYGSLMVFDRVSADRRPGVSNYLLAAGGGLLVGLLYGTRSLGMVVIPALFLNDIVRFRLISRTTLIVTIIFAMFYFAQNAFLHTDQSYFESFRMAETEELAGAAETSGEDAGSAGILAALENTIAVLAERVPRKLHSYGSMLSAYWYIGDSIIPGMVLLVLMTALAVAGFLNLILKSPSVADYFISTYVLILLVVPFGQERYLLPLVPLYLLYIARATEQVGILAVSLWGKSCAGIRHAAPVIVGLIFTASYASSYLLSNTAVFARGVEGYESRELFEFIRNNTPQDSFLVFYKPRPLALFTGRHATRYHWEPDGDKLWHDLSDMGVTHIVLPKYIDPAQHSEYTFPAFVEQHRGDLELLFENHDFIVFRIVKKRYHVP